MLCGERQPLLGGATAEDHSQFALEFGVAAGVVGVGRPGPAVEQVHAAGAFAEVAPERLLAGHEQHVAVVGFVELVANAFPHAAEAGLAPLVAVGCVAGDLALRSGVGTLGLDPVPVEVGSGVALRDLERRRLAGRPCSNERSTDGEGGKGRPSGDADVHLVRDTTEPVVVDHGSDDSGPRVVRHTV